MHCCLTRWVDDLVQAAGDQNRPCIPYLATPVGRSGQSEGGNSDLKNRHVGLSEDEYFPQSELGLRNCLSSKLSQAAALCTRGFFAVSPIFRWFMEESVSRRLPQQANG